MRALHVLVVDDEPLARGAVRRALEERGEVTRISESADARGANARLLAEEIDLVYLDVRLPGACGMDLARALAERMPPVVFVTAHAEFAAEAFEVRAIDYLRKPFTSERFHDSFERALDALRLQRSHAVSSTPRHLHVRTSGRTVLVPLEDIVWIEAANTYVRVHTNGHTHLLRCGISTLERELGPDEFARVHRSALVRLACVRELVHVTRGDYELVLANGDRVRASRRRREELVARLRRRSLGGD